MERCPDPELWRSSLSAMVDQEEPQQPRAVVAAHLASCEECAAWFRNATAQRELLSSDGGPRRDLTRHLVGVTEAHICACHTGGECHCTDCVCPSCTCQPAAS